MNLTELSKTAKAMVAPGKGLLAADESSGTIKTRSASSPPMIVVATIVNSCSGPAMR